MRHYQKNEGKKKEKDHSTFNKGFQNIHSGRKDRTPQEIHKNQEGMFCVKNTNKPKI